MDVGEQFCRIEARRRGGWLAIYDNGSLRIGVTAESEPEAKAQLVIAVEGWRRTLSERITGEASSASGSAASA